MQVRTWADWKAETNQDRVSWIERIRKGVGLCAPRVDVPLDLFGVESWEQLINLLRRIDKYMPPSKSSYAIYEALNFDVAWGQLKQPEEWWGHKPDLLAQRRLYAAKNLNVGLRTLMRLEHEGAMLLDSYIGSFIQPEHPMLLQEQGEDTLEELMIIVDKVGVPLPDGVEQQLKDYFDYSVLEAEKPIDAWINYKQDRARNSGSPTDV